MISSYQLHIYVLFLLLVVEGNTQYYPTRIELLARDKTLQSLSLGITGVLKICVVNESTQTSSNDDCVWKPLESRITKR